MTPPRPARPAPEDGAALAARVAVRRGAFTLDVEVDAGPGEVVAVVGPNGAGKSTLLRVLAGLLAVDEGRVAVGGAVWDDPASGLFTTAPDRAVGLVFQDYRLFPHLTVLDNVAFGARARGARRAVARRLAGAWLDRFELTGLASRRPAELSGGQAQRVALARALAGDPRLLLLDEPLAALDARTRLDVRSQVRRHLDAFPGPVLVVTHDPLEALVLADRILVLEGGRIVQDGPPRTVARRPATEYVARLMGLNLYPGTLADRATQRVELDSGGTLFAAAHDPDDDPPASPAGGPTLVVVPPSAIALHRDRPGPGSPRNVWPGTVVGVELLTDRVRVAVEGRPGALVDVTPAAVADLHLETGSEVWLSAKATEVTAYPDPGRAPLVP